MERMKITACLLIVSAISAGTLRAGVEPVATTEVARESSMSFARGTREFQNVTGAFFFFDTTVNDRPAIDYAVDSLRLGIMLNDPFHAGLLSGNFELMGELFGGGIFNGPGDVLAGATLLLRYNFLQPRACVVPYVQIGGGGVYTNISEGESRGLIGAPVEFNLQSTGGLRFMLNSRWSIVTEATYRHISNANLGSRNFGIDSLGGSLGFGFFF
jgi:hypothetical protein